MTAWRPFADSISLHVEGRISADDAARQEAAAREILRRFQSHPGVVLADEVGMGKTFVALAAAASVALSDKERRPVVVMVPSALKEKWPQDFAVFKEKCIAEHAERKVTAASAESAVELLRLLDDPPERRASIVFLTHGAMHRGLTDGWIKLAMIQRALKGRHHTGPLQAAFCRCAGSLLRLSYIEQRCGDVWRTLLERHPSEWLKILIRLSRRVGYEEFSYLDDDPVPQLVLDALERFDTSLVYDLLKDIPQRQSPTYEARVTAARQKLSQLLKELWHGCLTTLSFRLPLLVMDEAHHLKNADTQLASLFQNKESAEDADELTRGALGGVFERMLFLTATPFQLGHHELCSVLERFDAVAWDSADAPTCGRAAYHEQLRELRERLDAAQQAALSLDASWGLLRAEDLVANGVASGDVSSWWSEIQGGAAATASAERVREAYKRTFEKMRAAEAALRPWVIRHLRHRVFNGRPRRERLPGVAIVRDELGEHERGLDVTGPALLPFLLAARATVCSPESRPVFAEGLASSYEAFLYTRKTASTALDMDDDPGVAVETSDPVSRWYLAQLQRALPLGDHDASAAHPKIARTAERALAAWRNGEKVLVFCHYVATGRVLRQVISTQMRREIERLGAEKLHCESGEVFLNLERIGNRFFDTDSPVRDTCNSRLAALLDPYPALLPHREVLIDAARRYLRTPSFLVRYFPITEEGIDPEGVEAAFAYRDTSGLSLRDVLLGFFEFLERRCGEDERNRYLSAVSTVQTGTITGREAQATFADDEIDGGSPEQLLPNVRLVNGASKQETRQRLMLTFNSPFFPEVLVASSVMAEGVDLHRFCRYVIHHDLCWNPSTLEQRTGRVDRIGAKVEQCGHPIRIYLPYIAETQDEKMYRVVMDRERWFSVVMGEKFDTSARATDKLAERVPLPESVAQSLAFRLEVRSVASEAPAPQ